MGYTPDDISTIDAFIGYSSVNERGASEFKLPGYFEGVSSEIAYTYTLVSVLDGRNRPLEGVSITAVDTPNSNFVEEVTDANGSAIIAVSFYDKIILKKDKVFQEFDVSYSSQLTFNFEPPNFNPE
jgi:hypothetical protein